MLRLDALLWIATCVANAHLPLLKSIRNPCVSRYLNVGNCGFVRPYVEPRDLNLPFTGAKRKCHISIYSYGTPPSGTGNQNKQIIAQTSAKASHIQIYTPEIYTRMCVSGLVGVFFLPPGIASKVARGFCGGFMAAVIG